MYSSTDFLGSLTDFPIFWTKKSAITQMISPRKIQDRDFLQNWVMELIKFFLTYKFKWWVFIRTKLTHQYLINAFLPVLFEIIHKSLKCPIKNNINENRSLTSMPRAYPLSSRKNHTYQKKEGKITWNNFQGHYTIQHGTKIRWNKIYKTANRFFIAIFVCQVFMYSKALCLIVDFLWIAFDISIKLFPMLSSLSPTFNPLSLSIFFTVARAFFYTSSCWIELNRNGLLKCWKWIWGWNFILVAWYREWALKGGGGKRLLV